jgi:hypothetical protein
VPGVVPEEAELGGDDGEPGGHQQVPPGVADQQERGQRRHAQGQQQGGLQGVVAGTALEQAILLDLTGELCVRAAARRDGRHVRLQPRSKGRDAAGV